ncbi:hypothetical protein ACFX13_043232 [Malus domestica]
MRTSHACTRGRGVTQTPIDNVVVRIPNNPGIAVVTHIRTKNSRERTIPKSSDVSSLPARSMNVLNADNFSSISTDDLFKCNSCMQWHWNLEIASEFC